jgi:uncharacterized protein (DUF1501 family)
MQTLPHRFDPPCSRRRLLQAGVAGLGGLTLPNLLWARSRPGAAATGREKSCILIVLSGGPGQHETFDPKPHAPREIRGLYESIPTRTPGVRLSEVLPRLADCSDRYCLVRSMSHSDTVHVTAAHTMLSGQPDGSRSNNAPFMGSLISMLRPSQSALPSHVWLHNMKTGTNKVPRYDSGLNVIGHQYAALRIGYELDNPSNPDFRVSDFDPPEGLSVPQLERRFELLNELEARRNGRPGAPGYAQFQERAWDLVTGPAARQAFDLRHEPQAVRDRYGRHPLGQYCLMARRLIEAGVRLVTVTGWPGLAPGETQPTVTQVWDTHDARYGEGESMYGNGPFGMKWSLPRLDQALSTLLLDLDDRGLLEDTLVVCAGEFGRTPKFEGNGRGRGHWPQAYSTLLAGAGVRGGAVYGETDDQAAFVASGRPIDHVDFGATVYHALGIPPETRYGPDGFSFRVSTGEPLTEIFG